MIMVVMVVMVVLVVVVCGRNIVTATDIRIFGNSSVVPENEGEPDWLVS